MSQETPEQFLKRKHDAALKLIDQAVKANALSMPITTDGADQRGIPTITIQFHINEQKLHMFLEGMTK